MLPSLGQKSLYSWPAGKKAKKVNRNFRKRGEKSEASMEAKNQGFVWGNSNVREGSKELGK